MTVQLTADELDVTPADIEATRARMAQLRARGYTTVRRVLCQLPQECPDRVSTLGILVNQRKHRALLLYLLLLANWSWLSAGGTPLPAATWIRALTFDKGPHWSTSTLSRAWGDLERAKLIKRKRRGRDVWVEPRREDGRADYEPPTGQADRWNVYFSLPDAFWESGLFSQLTMPGLAMLLIIAAETSKKTEVPLIQAEMPKWYGISPKTMQNGIRDLEKHDLVQLRYERVSAPLSRTGYTTRTHYQLKGAYGTEARAAAQKQAQEERAKRLAAGTTTATEHVTPDAAAGIDPSAGPAPAGQSGPAATTP